MTLKTLQLSEPHGRVALRRQGAAGGVPLVLLHGVGMQSAAWAPQITELAQQRAVIALDLPGHGGSDPLPEGAGLAEFVAWLDAVLEALDLGPVALAGHSMGALIALGLAVSHPQRVDRLALLNGVYRRSPQARAAVVARAEEIRRGEIDLETPLARWFGDTPADQAARPQVAGWLAAMTPSAYATAYAAFARGDDVFADGLARLRMPFLALTGALDPNSSPEMARAMARQIPGGQVCVIDGHRHMVNLTGPAEVTAALTAWLDRAAEGPAFDPRALRSAFGAFLTGVTVVTTRDASGAPLGFTANSFTSVSLDPPLVLVCLANSSRNYAVFRDAPGFAVNILSEGQKDVSNTFARPVEDRFADIGWRDGPQGAPVLDGVSAWFDCSTHDRVQAGDHLILIGRVQGFDSTPQPGLGYARGAYVTAAAEAEALSAEAQAQAAGGQLWVSALIAHQGRVLLCDDGKGQLALPQARVGRDGTSAALKRLIAQAGVAAEPGFVYSVYEDADRATQHIAFLCQAASPQARAGMFTDLGASTLMDVADPAVCTMLERFAGESRLGNFGVYYGNQVSGEVRPLTARSSQ